MIVILDKIPHAKSVTGRVSKANSAGFMMVVDIGEVNNLFDNFLIGDLQRFTISPIVFDGSF